MVEHIGKKIRGVSVGSLRKLLNKTKLYSRCLLVLWLSFFKKVLKRMFIRFFETMALDALDSGSGQWVTCSEAFIVYCFLYFILKQILFSPEVRDSTIVSF